MKKSRMFSIVFYGTEKQLKKVMRDHLSSIRGFCYIMHDKDEAEVHKHVLLRTVSTWTENGIKRWFDLLKDEKGEYMNTFVEFANDIQSLVCYITHTDKQSVLDGKHLYSEDDIKDFGLLNDVRKVGNSVDNTYEIVEKMLLGVSPREMVRIYGRDYVFHISQYIEVTDRIRNYEGYRESFDRTLFDNVSLKKIDDMEDL